jgi:hypothetical protein
MSLLKQWPKLPVSVLLKMTVIIDFVLILIKKMNDRSLACFLLKLYFILQMVEKNTRAAHVTDNDHAADQQKRASQVLVRILPMPFSKVILIPCVSFRFDNAR